MARILVTRRLPGDAPARLEAAHAVEVWPERLPPPPDELLARARDKEGLLTMLSDRVDAALMDACPDLRVVSNYAVGSDNIDLEEAARRSIAVGVTSGVLTDATADLAFALILAAARRFPEAAAAVRSGAWKTWEPDWMLGYDVHGATLGIVGFGRIGRAVAQRATGFDMEVIHTGDRPLEEILARADAVSLHVPLTQQTRHLIDSAALRRMKPTAVLVNTARGGVVDQDALAAALREGRIAGAAIDVTDPEPLPPDHPLLAIPNLLVLPHVGSATHATRERMAAVAVDNLLAGLAGEPLPRPAAAP
jgi:glyoxylate reductase